MSTFDGYVQEIPYICVDRFEEKNKSAQVFFLTHCHSDHMKGLENQNLRSILFANDVYLYASAVSIRILKNRYFFGNNLKELPTGKPYTITVPTQFGQPRYLSVTTIPAGHCPGSVMFLFETEGKNILCTGDFRINTKELHKYKAFHDSEGNIKKIDALYLDTTFCNSKYEHFPTRIESVNEVCALIDKWITVSDRHIIDLHLPSYYGSENLLIDIFKRTKRGIHVLEEDYNLYKYMPDMVKILAMNSMRAKIHTRLNYINSCCNITKNNMFFVRTIKPSAMIWNDMKPSEKIVDRRGENYYCVCYSNHASFSEIREFVRYLKPLRIEPCVVFDDFDERKNLFKLLDEMISEYSVKQCSSKEGDGINQFPLVDVAGGKDVECTASKKEFDLLASPPRNFIKKRRLSEVEDS